MFFLPSLCSPHLWKEHCDSVSYLEVGVTWNTLDPENPSFCSTLCDLAMPTYWLTFEGENAKQQLFVGGKQPWKFCPLCFDQDKHIFASQEISEKAFCGWKDHPGSLHTNLVPGTDSEKAESAYSIPKAVLQQANSPLPQTTSSANLCITVSSPKRGKARFLPLKTAQPTMVTSFLNKNIYSLALGKIIGGWSDKGRFPRRSNTEVRTRKSSDKWKSSVKKQLRDVQNRITKKLLVHRHRRISKNFAT